MAESPSPDLRIGDPEREEALRVLGEHMSVGRLDVDEYGERAARASAAKTRGELTALFTDLPLPHPRLDQLAAPPPQGVHIVPQPLQREVAGRDAHRPRAQAMTGALVPLSAILAAVLFFAAGVSWVVFLLPAAVAVIVGALMSGQPRSGRRDPSDPRDAG